MLLLLGQVLKAGMCLQVLKDSQVTESPELGKTLKSTIQISHRHHRDFPERVQLYYEHCIQN